MALLLCFFLISLFFCLFTTSHFYIYAQEAQVVTEKNQSLQDRLDFANGLYNRSMYEMAILEYDSILEENSNHPAAGDILFRLAESHFFLKKYEEAISLYQTFTQSQSKHPQIDTARLRLGEGLYQLGDKDSSLNQMQNLTKNNDPKIKQMALYYTGKIFYEKEKYAEAKEYLIQIAESTDKSPYQEIAHYYLGEVYLKNKRLRECCNTI
jgi:TolA-binding protein